MEAFESIYGEYFPRVYGFIYRMCRDENLAEELTQETFYQAFRSFRKFRGESELFTWLAAIAKFTVLRYIRKNKCADLVNLDLIADTISDDEGNPEASAQKQETTENIRAAVMRMPDKYRDVVLLRIYADLPFSEIAESMNITENSAKVLFHRAKKMLTEELKNEYFM